MATKSKFNLARQKKKRTRPNLPLVVSVFIFVIGSSLVAYGSFVYFEEQAGQVIDETLVDFRNPTPLLSDLATKNGYGGNELWTDIMKEGQQLMKERQESGNTSRLVAIEVGANTAEQAIAIAEYGLESHSVEPSPKAFASMIQQVESQPADIKDRIFMYNAAAGASGEGEVLFRNTGSTGAHILSDAEAENNNISVVKIKSITMQQIFDNKVKPDYNSLPHDDFNVVYAAKIDVQGFEPMVFKGMKEAIQNHKIDYILSEWWPAGINKMNNYSERCHEALQYLYMMADAGYTLYASHVVGHPHAGGYKHVKTKQFRKNLPFHDIKLYCLELYKVHDTLGSGTSAYGYWADVLAVSPNASLPRDPASDFGKAVKKNMDNANAKHMH